MMIGPSFGSMNPDARNVTLKRREQQLGVQRQLSGCSSVGEFVDAAEAVDSEESDESVDARPVDNNSHTTSNTRSCRSHSNSNVPSLVCAFLASATTGGTTYGFGLFASALKRSLKLSQSQLDTVSSCIFFAGLFSFLPGYCSDRFGARLALISGGCTSAISLLLYWMVATQYMEVPRSLLVPVLSILGICMFLSSALITGAVFKTIVACCNVGTKGSAVGIAKGYVGLGAGLYACIFESIRSSWQSSGHNNALPFSDLDFLLLAAFFSIVCVTLPGSLLLPTKSTNFVRLTSTNAASFYVDETTPWHYRTLFLSLFVMVIFIVGNSLLALSDATRTQLEQLEQLDQLNQSTQNTLPLPTSKSNMAIADDSTFTQAGLDLHQSAKRNLFGPALLLVTLWMGPILLLLYLPRRQPQNTQQQSPERDRICYTSLPSEVNGTIRTTQRHAQDEDHIRDNTHNNNRYKKQAEGLDGIDSSIQSSSRSKPLMHMNSFSREEESAFSGTDGVRRRVLPLVDKNNGCPSATNITTSSSTAMSSLTISDSTNTSTLPSSAVGNSSSSGNSTTGLLRSPRVAATTIISKTKEATLLKRVSVVGSDEVRNLIPKKKDHVDILDNAGHENRMIERVMPHLHLDSSKNMAIRSTCTTASISNHSNQSNISNKSNNNDYIQVGIAENNDDDDDDRHQVGSGSRNNINNRQMPSEKEGKNLIQMLQTPQALIMLMTATILVGAGTVITNNVGQMVESLGFAATVTPAAASIFSVAQASGRIICGAVTESALKWNTKGRCCIDHGIPRTFFFILSAMIACVAHAILADSKTEHMFITGAALAGISFGMVWPLLVLVVGELFGSANVGANYMFFDGCTSAVGTLLLSKLVAQYVYESHIDATASDIHTCIGSGCFRNTFLTISTLSGCCILTSACLMYSSRHVYNKISLQTGASTTMSTTTAATTLPIPVSASPMTHTCMNNPSSIS